MRRRGFTLVEVLAAIVIVAVGLVSVVELFGYGTRAAVLQEDRVLAMGVLRRAVEEAKAKGFNEDATMPSGSDYDPDYPARFTYSVSEDAAFASPLDVKRIDVTVEWTTAGWGSQQVTITTLVAKR